MVYLKHLLEFHAQGDPQTKSVYLSSDQRMQLQIKKLNLYIYIYIHPFTKMLSSDRYR